MSEIDYTDNCYPGMAPAGQAPCYRFSDKDNQDNERLLFDNWWSELINQYGSEVTYYANTFNTLSADNIYGEDPTKKFADPLKIVIAVNLQDNAITLSQYGFMSDDEVTAYIHITTFANTFAPLSAMYNTQNGLVEPKAGDVFQLSEFGDDRPAGRQPKYFEITEKLDEDISQINQLGGHYVFIVRAKRFDYSYEPGIPFNGISEGIIGNQQVFEDDATGTVDTEPKKEFYDESSADNTSIDDVFDMGQNNTDVYGDYY